MNILAYKSDESSDEKTGVILRQLQKLVCDFDYLVPDGWRFILKMQDACDSEPYYHIDIQSDRGGGDYAEAKMSTLEQFPGRVATGGETIEQLCDMLQAIGVDDEEIFFEVRDAEGVDQLYYQEWEMLRDKYKLAPCYGGIRVYYKDLTVDGDCVNYEAGEIRFAFSGASEEQDIFFGLGVFKELINSFVRIYPDTQGWYDIRELSCVPAVKFWIDILGITEAV